jgi:hypothetical protein
MAQVAPKVEKLYPSDYELLCKLADENSDLDQAFLKFAVRLSGQARPPARLVSALTTYAEYLLGGKIKPKSQPEKAPKLPRGTAQEILRKAAIRAARAQEAARFLVRLSEDMTMHDAWVQGGGLRKLGKQNDTRKFFSVHSRAKIEKAGFCQA